MKKHEQERILNVNNIDIMKIIKQYLGGRVHVSETILCTDLSNKTEFSNHKAEELSAT